MNYSVKAIPVFENALKRLAKKYPSLKSEYTALVESLKKNPFQGTALGQSCYKIRLAVASKGKGKSGGARVITNVAILIETVYLIAIYDKSEKVNLTDKELKLFLKEVPEQNSDKPNTEKSDFLHQKKQN